MLTNCIHRYVLFIARLKGIYTYYEEKSLKKVTKSTIIPCEHGSPLLAFVTNTRHCNMTVYIDLMRMKMKRTL